MGTSKGKPMKKQVLLLLAFPLILASIGGESTPKPLDSSNGKSCLAPLFKANVHL